MIFNVLLITDINVWKLNLFIYLLRRLNVRIQSEIPYIDHLPPLKTNFTAGLRTSQLRRPVEQSTEDQDLLSVATILHLPIRILPQK